MGQESPSVALFQKLSVAGSRHPFLIMTLTKQRILDIYAFDLGPLVRLRPDAFEGVFSRHSDIVAFSVTGNGELAIWRLSITRTEFWKFRHRVPDMPAGPLSYARG